MGPQDQSIPPALSAFFILHFALDVAFALPMFVIPVRFLTLLGWQTIDPITTRLVAAALFGIGIESLIGRKAPIESFRSLLNLKIVWSVAAVAGILLSMIERAFAIPMFVWVVLAIFVAFSVLWIYYRVRLERADSAGTTPNFGGTVRE